MPTLVKKRTYISPKRQAKAEATRARIIGAATTLFLERGYRRSSTAAISKAARTSEASVFAAFGSKADLLVAVVKDHVVRHSDFPLRNQPFWQTLAADANKTRRRRGDRPRCPRRSRPELETVGCGVGRC